MRIGPDETWHRLREWTHGQALSERLAAQVLISEGYGELDPSHPLGGPDGGKDALCAKDGKRWVMAVHFPRGQQTLGSIKKKLLEDLHGVAANGADALAFVTNQELVLGDRDALKEAADPVPVELYHLDRVVTILCKPTMLRVRKDFLGIDFAETWPDPVAGAASLEQLASRVEATVPARVEILARQGDRLIVWMKPDVAPTRSNLGDAKMVLLATACLLSGVEDIQSLEIGFSDTSELRHSIGTDGIGCWRVRFDVEDARNVATTKEVDPNLWNRAKALRVAGDNFRVGQKEVPFDEFEATA